MANPHLPLPTAFILMFNMRLCTKNCPWRAQFSQGSGEPNPLCHGQGSATLPAPHGEFPQLQLFPRGLKFKLNQLFCEAALARSFVPGLCAILPWFRTGPRLQKGGISSISFKSFTPPHQPSSILQGPPAHGGFCSHLIPSSYENSQISSFAAAAEIPCFRLLLPHNAQPHFRI